jgi:hypothetical protein
MVDALTLIHPTLERLRGFEVSQGGISLRIHHYYRPGSRRKVINREKHETREGKPMPCLCALGVLGGFNTIREAHG